MYECLMPFIFGSSMIQKKWGEKNQMDVGNKRGEMDLGFFNHAGGLTVSRHNAQ